MINMVTGGAVHCLIVRNKRECFLVRLYIIIITRVGSDISLPSPPPPPPPGPASPHSIDFTRTKDIKVITLPCCHILLLGLFLFSNVPAVWKCGELAVLVSWCYLFQLQEWDLRSWMAFVALEESQSEFGRAQLWVTIRSRGCPSSPAHKTANFHCVTLSLSDLGAW